ncbi:MAG: hypothetical protein JNM52_05330, partial [Betaproteobacteria bacterium]|nr:hypothetical protein [Betaproteobacteria bacterium]
MKIYRFVGVVLASLLGFAANAQQMPSRALESALPSEPLTALKLYSTDAPSRDIRIAPTAKQLAQAAADSRSGPGGVKTVGEQLGLRKANLPAVPLRVGSVFSAKMPKSELSWQPLSATESVTHLRVSSEGAMGIRARLVLPSDLNQGEIRVIGSADEKVISLPLSVAQDGTLWTPYTEGDRQLIEILARQPVTGSLFQVADIAHFEYSLLTAGGPGQPGKPALAASCTIDVACPSGNANLDAAITDRSKSVARINYMSNGSAFLCSGTVINSQQFP